ncbi:MAG: pimelyl-ACP methyl ester esterase BioV [Epsilonproteobacteria bacterium]|nr:pimelyl-ACP methyl ester esterase BioV [Campylobacterota bacterium]
MRYFSGFALKGEEQFFQEYLIDSEFTVAGFSYGAQQAFEYVYNSKERIDRLILLSPAFFQNHKASFIRTQLRYFKADEEAYTEQFLKNVSYPSSSDLHPYLSSGSYKELEALLNYVWDRDKILELKRRGVIIEVFIGADDKIVEAKKSFEFFSNVTTTYFFKGLGHLLN